MSDEDNVDNFFRGDCGIVECECKANHSYIETPKTINIGATCCFNKMMISILNGEYGEAFNICERDGLDNVFGDVSDASNGRLNRIFRKWGMCKLDELMKDIVDNGLEMFVSCEKKEQVTGKCKRCDFVICYAAFHGHINITRLCKKWRADNFNGAIVYAARGGNIEIVELCKEWGVRNFEDSMCLAAYKGHIEIVELCREWGAKNFVEVADRAASGGHIEIIKLCKEWGATNFDDAICWAA